MGWFILALCLTPYLLTFTFGFMALGMAMVRTPDYTDDLFSGMLLLFFSVLMLAGFLAMWERVL